MWVCYICNNNLRLIKHFGKWIGFFDNLKKHNIDMSDEHFFCYKCNSFVFAKNYEAEDVADKIDKTIRDLKILNIKFNRMKELPDDKRIINKDFLELL